MIIYNVNEEKGTVVARFAGEESGRDYWRKSLVQMVEKIFNPVMICDPHWIVDDVLAGMPDLTGKARLHPFDTFDEEVGKRMAKQRLNDKFNRVKDRILVKLKEYVDYQSDLAWERINRKQNK